MKEWLSSKTFVKFENRVRELMGLVKRVRKYVGGTGNVCVLTIFSCRLRYFSNDVSGP